MTASPPPETLPRSSRSSVDGGAGNDTILGTNGIDLLLGGDGDDFVDGQQGNDVAFLGAGDDTFQWDPGDGSDTIEGQEGTDTMLFNGNGANELFEASANGGRLLFTRDVGSIVMDANDVEVVDLNALGGTDTITVNDLSGTDVSELNPNLAGTLGGTAGDGQPDAVIVHGTTGDDVVLPAGDASGVAVIGLAAQVNITGAEAANDRLTVNALAGDDVVDASGLAAGSIQLTADGGDGDDVLLGGDGDDVLLGGAGRRRAPRRSRHRHHRRRRRRRHRNPKPRRVTPSPRRPPRRDWLLRLAPTVAGCRPTARSRSASIPPGGPSTRSMRLT